MGSGRLCVHVAHFDLRNPMSWFDSPLSPLATGSSGWPRLYSESFRRGRSYRLVLALSASGVQTTTYISHGTGKNRAKVSGHLLAFSQVPRKAVGARRAVSSSGVGAGRGPRDERVVEDGRVLRKLAGASFEHIPFTTKSRWWWGSPPGEEVGEACSFWRGHVRDPPAAELSVAWPALAASGNESKFSAFRGLP